MLEILQLPYVQRGLIEVLILAPAAGLVGTWIVLRGLAFYSHAVGAAAFPGLVLADGLGFAAGLGAFGTAAIVAGGVTLLAGRRHSGYDSLTAIVLVGCLAAGVILASDVFRSGSSVETLLFGSLLVIERSDLVLAGAVGAVALLATYGLGPRWTATGFDPAAARSLGLRSSLPDLALLVLIALVAIASLAALGALLATALFVIPAATVRLWTRRLLAWQVASVALVALEGTLGLWLAVETNAPPGATIAVVAGAIFALALLARALRSRRGMALLVGACLAGILAGCGGDPETAGVDPDALRVVATTTQIGDFARQVGGDEVSVTQILSPNTDAHDYEPRPDDVRAAAEADIVFVNGAGLDPWMEGVIGQSGGDPAVVDLGETDFPLRVPGEEDPHWWHDPVGVRAAIVVMRDALIAADPERRDGLSRGASAYLAKLEALDAGIRRCFRAVPPAERTLVTDHDAFGYFTRRYGITFVGAVIPSQTTQAQPSAGDVARLVTLIRRERVRAVFPESSINPRLAEAVARETGASVGDTLYGDSLGPEGSSGDTYLRMEAANAAAMVRGFSGGGATCSIAGIE